MGGISKGCAAITEFFTISKNLIPLYPFILKSGIQIISKESAA